MESSQFDLLAEYHGTFSSEIFGHEDLGTGGLPRVGEAGLGLGGGKEMRSAWGGLEDAREGPLQG